MSKNNAVLLAIITVWIFFITLSVWPASHWLDIDSIHVEDSYQGDPIVMKVDRDIKRTFYADWNVTIRQRVHNGFVIKCYTQASTDYRVDAVYPDPLTLTWWANGDCENLAPGSYVMTTTWKIRPDWFGIAERKLTVESNTFRILDRNSTLEPAS